MIKDKNFIQRKMDHYNKWMLDSNRDPNSRYPGFPEEIAMEFARKQFVEEFLSRPKKRKGANEKAICEPSTTVSAKSGVPSSA